VALEAERELELGADAVGARDQDRLAEFFRDPAQRAEAADASGRSVRRACGLIASTSASPASMSTPASR
jgi:hypothetical protein